LFAYSFANKKYSNHMCLTSSLPAQTTCNIAGSIRRLLVAKASDVVLSGLTASFTFGTTTTRYQITDIEAALNWYEIPFDKTRDATASAENTRAGAGAFTHTVSVNISTDDFDTQRSIMELQDCCGYVALVQHSTGRWAMYGLNFSKDDSSYDPAQLKVTANFTTGANVADEAAGHNVTISSTNVTSYWLPVSAAAAAGVTIVAHSA